MPKRRGRSNIATTSSANPTENDNLGASSVPVVNNFAEMDLKCASAGIPAKIISMCVVPVIIGHVGTKKEVSTLAMLDKYSQGTFMKESIKKKLGISGRKTEITIKTLNGKQNMELNVHGEGIRWLNLPAAYTREALPADVEEVATLEKARKWEHLKIVADKLLTETYMEIGLPIGANCSKALEPEEVLLSKDGEPFPFRTPLGWCAVGLLTKFGKESSISCNQIVVQDAATRKIASHHFGITSKVKDIDAKQMFKNIYNRVL